MRRRPYGLEEDAYQALDTAGRAALLRKLAAEKRLIAEIGSRKHRVVDARSRHGLIRIRVEGAPTFVAEGFVLVFLSETESIKQILSAPAAQPA